jgi:predicted GTPase
VVVDPLRPGHELLYHPGEANVRMADLVVVNKVDTAYPQDVAHVVENVRAVNPDATIVRAASPVSLEDGPPLAGKRVLVVDDGPTITHGGMPYGAGTVAARQAGVKTLVDPRPYAVGSIAETFEKFSQIGSVLPAMGYGDDQLRELEATINATDCDAVIAGTPMNLARLIDIKHPVRHATYAYADDGQPTLAYALASFVETHRTHLLTPAGVVGG